MEKRLYNIWVDMRQRCKTDGHAAHKYWGGKGIKVCPEWNDYKAFEKWALENGYEDNLTIDRKDGTKDYCPENCRWATYSEQNRNMASNHYIEINGESHIVADWCKILGTVTPSTVYSRVRNEGWSYEKALLTPGQKSKSLHPEKTELLYAAKRKPLIAYNETEVIEFSSSKEAERQGHCRGAIRKAILTRQRHHGYYWKFKEELVWKA